MDLQLEQLSESLRIIVSLLTALLAPLGRPDGSKSERWTIAVVAAVIVFVLWPVDISYCKHTTAYAWAFSGLLVWCLVAHIADVVIVRQFGHTQVRREDESVSATTILGGPILTPAAAALQRNEGLSSQQIFEILDYDPLRMWERWPRTALHVAHRIATFTKGLAFLLAIVAALAYFNINRQTSKAHRALTLEPSKDQTMLAGRSVAFTATLQECRPDVAWDIEGLTTERTRGSLGEISQTGTFSAPLQIDREIDLYVVATPLEHPGERRKVKIQLRLHPDYGTSYDTTGEDENQNQANFTIEVIDKRYSWVIGKNVLNGEEGYSFAKRMAADGLFSGFQDIICIGAASREYKNKNDEEQRALGRAQALGSWVRNALHPNSANIWALKIGRYDDEIRLTPEQTSQERQVVIVGVLGADKGVNLMSALRNAFAKRRAQEPLLGMYLDKYPVKNWELQKMRAHE